MIVKVALAFVGLVLSMLGVVLAAEEGEYANEYEVFRRMMTSSGGVADANVIAAASIVSRGEHQPSPQTLT